MPEGFMPSSVVGGSGAGAGAGAGASCGLETPLELCLREGEPDAYSAACLEPLGDLRPKSATICPELDEFRLSEQGSDFFTTGVLIS